MIQSALKAKANKKISETKPPHFYWARLGGRVLLTNDAGCSVWLNEKDFRSLLGGGLKEGNPSFAELSENGFIRTQLNFDDLSLKCKRKEAHLQAGPGLHIFVTTLRCNHKCLYCQSGAINQASKGTDMSWPTAKKSVDFAFESPSRGITIEFQGGEPLLNWKTVEKTVRYARKKEKDEGRELGLALVSNFSLMTEEKAAFLIANEVSVCASLDGPEELHNRNRLYAEGSSYKPTVKWLKYFSAKSEKQKGENRVFRPSALLTVTKYSLGRHKEIIDEYVKLGMDYIFVRSLAPIGYAKNLWGTIGYSAEEFVKFYRDSLAYIIELNLKGTAIKEKMAVMMLKKIVRQDDPMFVDLRCPCGAGIGQLAYDYNGDIYTCDEGRMLAWEGDELFKAGNVFKSKYAEVILSPAVKACAAASNLEIQPVCFRCVYKPFCGVCPVYNYEAQGSLWGSMPSNERCAALKGIFETVFLSLRDKKSGAVLRSWVEK
ncbi:MAG: His-Xaa-Ser system radical SAM maturase HxsB [Elusimicrobia bacterium]|nr:His-Xaa-Ser system radical SAM maturase HxsB [Elusimicrobiota bacterium]